MPLAPTVTWTFTTPVILIRLASSGYTGATLIFGFRLISPCARASGALVAAHAPISNKPIANLRFSARKDTVPPRCRMIVLIFEQGPHPRIPKVLSLHYFRDR
jgi:hypothetical protein